MADQGTVPSGNPFRARVAENQQRLATNLQAEYDVVIVGAGSSGSVIAGRLAADPSITVLVLEAGGSDDVSSVQEASLWPTNLNSERDWAFVAEPDPNLKSRALPMSMGKVLGGGSSINLMVWARGHRADWDFIAEQSGDRAWAYDSIVDVYRKVEDYKGPEDNRRRGVGGPLRVLSDPVPTAESLSVMEVAAECLGVPVFSSPNASMMEAPGGVAVSDLLVQDGRRVSVFRSYVYPRMDRPNLTVLTGARARRVVLAKGLARAVEFEHRGALCQVGVRGEVVLSAGAVCTPKLLLHSGVGDARQLVSHGVEVHADLPGVGENFTDHLGIPCMWEWDGRPSNDFNVRAALYWPADDAETPDFFAGFAFGMQYASAEALARFRPPQNTFSFLGAVSHPESRGRVTLTGADPDGPVRIELNALSHPDDLRLTKQCLKDMQMVGNSPALRKAVGRQVMPTGLTDNELDEYIRQSVVTYFHQAGTTKMGTDASSVVDSHLRVIGIENLRVAGASILPRLSTGNTMASCVVIGERAAEMLLKTLR